MESPSYTDDNTTLLNQWYTEWYPQTCVPNFYTYCYQPQPDKCQSALSIVKHLSKKGYLKLNSINDFIAVIEDIISVL